MAAQAANSLSSLVVAVVVAQLLGPASLGKFAVLFTLLLTFVAWQSSWVGNSLTVLDREAADVRQGVSTTQWLHVVVGAPLAGWARPPRSRHRGRRSAGLYRAGGELGDA